MSYTYSLSTNFLSGINVRQLDGEIRASAITIYLNSITNDNVDVVIIFVDSITSGDEIILDDIVANHVPESSSTTEGTTDPTDPNYTITASLKNVLNIPLDNTPQDGGYLIQRYQTENNAGTGIIVSETATTIGTAQTGSTSTTIKLASGSSSIVDFYKNWWIKITAGTGINQVRKIIAYDGTTKVATLLVSINTLAQSWTTTPDNTSVYALYFRDSTGLIFDSTLKSWKLLYHSGSPSPSLMSTDYTSLGLLDLNLSGNIVRNNNSASFSSGTTYSAGTASQSTTTITGSSTTFTAAMVGGIIIFVSGTKAFITGFTSATSLTCVPSQTVSSQAYIIYYGTNQIGLGYMGGTGLNLSGLTASGPVKTDANKNLVSTSINLTSDVTGTLANSSLVASNITQFNSSINHDTLLNYVANKHVDHSTVSISTATGLTGGGTIAATRTISLDINALTEETSPVNADLLLLYDVSGTTHKKVSLTSVATLIGSCGGSLPANFNYSQSTNTFTTTSTSYITMASPWSTLTTASLPIGSYKISWSGVLASSSTSKASYSRCYLDGTTQIGEIITYAQSTSSPNTVSISGWHIAVFASAATHTITLQIKVDSGATATLRNPRVDITKVV